MTTLAFKVESMKSLALTILSLSLISCGKNEFLKATARNFADDGAKVEAQSVNKRLTDLEQRMALLESSHLSYVNSITLTENRILGLEMSFSNDVAKTTAQIISVEGKLAQLTEEDESLKADMISQKNMLQDQLNTLITRDNSHETEIANMGSLITSLQSNANEVLVKMAELRTQSKTVEFIDVCGDGPGFDEVLLRLENGTLIRYFEEKGDRYLTVLQAGSYKTTDRTNCNFNVSQTGTVSW
jgi:hypothetical protein